MKAIKIASGVAITALAAAISAQANAAAHEGGDTETTFSYTGSMEFLTVVDMADGYTNADGDDTSVIDVTLDEEDDFDSATAGEAWGLEMDVAVVHGPFSGSVGVRTDDGNAEVYAGDIVITDGAISFGQTGSLVDQTHEYAYDMGDSNDDVDEDSEGKDVDAALRYTMEGLKVQVEGSNSQESDGYTTDGDEDYGVGAQYAGEADALSYVAEVQYRATSYGGSDDSAYTYLGAGATYTMDMVTAKVGFNTYTVDDTTEPGANDDRVVEYGFELTATPIDALSVYVKGQDMDSGEAIVEDNMKVLGGAAYTAGMITVTGEYLYTAVEEAGDEVFGEVAYADGPIGAYGSVTLANIDADTADAPMIEAGVSYTQENGVKYAADFDFRAEEEDATVNQANVNNLRLSAAYAF